MTDALEAIGERVAPPDAAVHRATLARLAPVRPRAGRLVDVAAWWAAARGEEHPAAPRMVTHLWAAPDDEPVDGADREPASDSAGEPAAEPAGEPAAEPDAEPAAVPAVEPCTDARVAAQPLDPPPAVADAIAWGAAAADAAADGGEDLLLVSVPDERDARILAACLMGLDPVDAVGWPHDADLSDEDWTELVVDVRDGLRRVRGLRGRPADLLEALGSPVLAAGTAAILRAAARRTPIVLDGYGALVSAILARRVARPATSWWLVAQAGQARHLRRAITSLNAEPLLDLGVDVEDGTSARLGLALLEAACPLLRA